MGLGYCLSATRMTGSPGISRCCSGFSERVIGALKRIAAPEMPFALATARVSSNE